ncbi:hypothetical protein [Streptomyces sp. NPDC001450]
MDSNTEPTACAPTSALGTKYYGLVWWHSRTHALSFPYDKEFVVRWPLADDDVVCVSDITQTPAVMPSCRHAVMPSCLDP